MADEEQENGPQKSTETSTGSRINLLEKWTTEANSQYGKVCEVGSPPWLDVACRDIEQIVAREFRDQVIHQPCTLEDLAQETTAAFLRRLQSPTPPQEVYKSFVVTIARSKLVDAYRKTLAKVRPSTDCSSLSVQSSVDLLNEVMGPVETPSQQFVVQERAEVLWKTVGAILKPEEQFMLDLKHVLGLSYEEIAFVCDRSVQMLRCQFSRIHAKLRPGLQALPEFSSYAANLRLR